MKGSPSPRTPAARQAIVGLGLALACACAPPQQSEPFLIADVSKDWIGDGLRLGVDARGNALVAWRVAEFAGDRAEVRARRWSAGSGRWGESKRLNADDPRWAEAPLMASNGDGQVALAWNGGERSTIVGGCRADTAFTRGLRLDTGSWSHAAANPGLPEAGNLVYDLAMNSIGESVLLWGSKNPDTPALGWQLRSPDGSWGESRYVEGLAHGGLGTECSSSYFGAQISLGDAGELLVTATRSVGADSSQSFVMLYDPASESWSAPIDVPIDPSITESDTLGYPRPINSRTALHVRRRRPENSNIEPRQIAVSIFELSSGAWSDAYIVNPNNLVPIDPALSVASSPEGNIAIGWVQGGYESISAWTAQYDASAESWSEPAEIISAGANQISGLTGAFGGEDHLVMAWLQYDGQAHSVWATRQALGAGLWEEPAVFAREEADTWFGGPLSVGWPQLAVAQDGSALLGWRRAPINDAPYAGIQVPGRLDEFWAAHYWADTAEP